MAKLTISKMAKLYGLSRGAIYDKVAKGNLTATLNEQGQKVVDMVDMISLYGEPVSNKSNLIEQQQTIQNSSKQTEFDSVELYKKMLDISESARLKAEDREERLFNEISQLKNEIKELKNVLGYSGKSHTEQQQTVQNSLIEQDNQTVLNSNEQNKTELMNPKEYSMPVVKEEEPKQRSFWSKFFLPNG